MQIFKNRAFAFFALTLGLSASLLSSLSFAVAMDEPVQMIQKKDAELQKLLKDKDSSKKTDKIKFLINDIFDFEELGKKALGAETWKTLNPNQQSRFVKAFKQMVENASVKKLEVYQNDSTQYEKPEGETDHLSVTTHVFSKGQESIIVYKLFKKEGAWRAWDLVIDDLSTARNYGEQFKKILQTNTIDGLIAKLEKKSKGELAKVSEAAKPKAAATKAKAKAKT